MLPKSVTPSRILSNNAPIISLDQEDISALDDLTIKDPSKHTRLIKPPWGAHNLLLCTRFATFGHIPDPVTTL